MRSGVFSARTGNRLGGELRYDYMPGDLKVSSGGNEATFAGRSHAIHYDAMFNFTSSEAAVRPFVEGGAGVRIFEGTGNPTVTQPLSNLALLTNTYETKALFTVGGGVKARIGSRIVFRLEVQDFISPFPRQVIAPAPGAKIDGILHDLVFSAGIGIAFVGHSRKTAGCRIFPQKGRFPRPVPLRRIITCFAISDL